MIFYFISSFLFFFEKKHVKTAKFLTVTFEFAKEVLLTEERISKFVLFSGVISKSDEGKHLVGDFKILTKNIFFFLIEISIKFQIPLDLLKEKINEIIDLNLFYIKGFIDFLSNKYSLACKSFIINLNIKYQKYFIFKYLKFNNIKSKKTLYYYSEFIKPFSIQQRLLLYHILVNTKYFKYFPHLCIIYYELFFPSKFSKENIIQYLESYKMNEDFNESKKFLKNYVGAVSETQDENSMLNSAIKFCLESGGSFKVHFPLFLRNLCFFHTFKIDPQFSDSYLKLKIEILSDSQFCEAVNPFMLSQYHSYLLLNFESKDILLKDLLSYSGPKFNEKLKAQFSLISMCTSSNPKYDSLVQEIDKVFIHLKQNQNFISTNASQSLDISPNSRNYLADESYFVLSDNILCQNLKNTSHQKEI